MLKVLCQKSIADVKKIIPVIEQIIAKPSLEPKDDVKHQDRLLAHEFLAATPGSSQQDRLLVQEFFSATPDGGQHD